MTFSVTGYVDGVAYTVNVGDTDPAEGSAVFKAASGSPVVVDLLQANDGLDYDETPVSPGGTLDAADGTSIAHALHALTTVSEMHGDAPNLYTPDGPLPAGAVH